MGCFPKLIPRVYANTKHTYTHNPKTLNNRTIVQQPRSSVYLAYIIIKTSTKDLKNILELFPDQITNTYANRTSTYICNSKTLEINSYLFPSLIVKLIFYVFQFQIKIYKKIHGPSIKYNNIKYKII